MPEVQLRNSQSRNDGSLKKDHMAFNRKVNIFLYFFSSKRYTENASGAFVSSKSLVLTEWISHSTMK